MTPAARDAVETLWQRFAAHDWDGARDVLHPDFTCHWPQSAESVRGRDTFLAMNRAHPAPNWRIDGISVVGASADDPGSSHLAAAHVLVSTDEGLDICVGFYGRRGRPAQGSLGVLVNARGRSHAGLASGVDRPDAS